MGSNASFVASTLKQMYKLSNSGRKAVTFISSCMYAANHMGFFIEWQTKKNDFNPTYTLIKATEWHHFKPEILTPLMQSRYYYTWDD